jgi:hypothetical protein
MMMSFGSKFANHQHYQRGKERVFFAICSRYFSSAQLLSKHNLHLRAMVDRQLQMAQSVRDQKVIAG